MIGKTSHNVIDGYMHYCYDGGEQLTKSAAYDDADYYWARRDPIAKEWRIIDPKGRTFSHWGYNTSVDDIIYMLKNKNKEIKPRMMYN